MSLKITTFVPLVVSVLILVMDTAYYSVANPEFLFGEVFYRKNFPHFKRDISYVAIKMANDRQ